MATGHKYGSARITYTAAGGAQVVYLLAAKLIELEPVDVLSRYAWWAASYRHTMVVEVGDADSGASDLIASIRFDDDPDGLKALLLRGLQGATLSYQETEGGTVYPLTLVRVVGATSQDACPIRPDRARFRLGEYMARIHVRRVDGGSLSALLGGGA